MTNQSATVGTTRPSAYPPEWNVLFAPATPLPDGYRTGRRTELVRKGSVLIEDGKPLACDVVWEQDIPITLRDGVVIYTDVLRPADQDTDLPAIISWSSYGKSLPTPPPPGVAPQDFSGLGKFEGADAAFWLDHGYALVNPDARGSGTSEGHIQYWGSVDSHDGYDVVEWTAEQPWSNGKVALYGASWLAIAQWGIAATRPPHLAAIAPWNGIYDMYRTHMVWGGIPDPGFFDFIPVMVPGRQSIEQIGAMAVRENLLNDYWEDKTPDLSGVSVPAYVVVDGVTGLHSMGGPEAFRRLGSSDKWLRFNNTHEWIDQYSETYQHDVLRFFDRYLKGTDNDWSETPRVRATIINAGGSDIVDRPFSQWPPAETTYRRLYLDSTQNSLTATPPTATGSLRYPAADGEASFTITFEQDTVMVGYLSLHLWVEVEEADDMDLFVLVEKLDADGHLLVPHREIADTYPVSPPGAAGRLRVSLRELDTELTTEFLPVHAFRRHQNLQPGEIVPVDIGLTPRAYKFEKGQQLRLTVAGSNVRGAGVDTESVSDDLVRAGRLAAMEPHAYTHGVHVIHTSAHHPSYLTLPLVDAGS